MTEDGQSPDAYEELFHELRSDRNRGTPSVIGIVVGLLVGFGLIVAAIVAWGNESDLPTQAPTYACGGQVATIVGTDGDDVIEGTNRRDVIHARQGNDIVNAGRGNDIVCGGKGDDELNGDRGRDELYGENGEDVCRGGGGTQDTFDTCETEEQ